MSFQAFIFDLDDTLIDTYGQLVKEAHYQACLAMHQEGLDIPVDTLFETRMRLIQAHPREEINQLLAQHYDCPSQAVIDAGFQTYFNPVITELELLPGVEAILAMLSQRARLFLVTSGFESAQKRKVEVLGIAPIFDALYYVDIKKSEGKKEAFEQILKEYGYVPEQVLVIGDRITNEIVAANQLGIPTVWIQRGECLNIVPQSELEAPNITIHDIQALTQAIETLERT